MLCLEETHGAPSAVSVRSVALAALVVLGLLGTALGACGGRVDLDEPKPLGSATATATSNTPGTGTSSPLPPGSVVPPSTGTSRPPPPPPRCNPDDCALPNTSAATCEGGRCVPAVCDEGFLSCDGDPSNGCEAVAEVLYPDEDGDGFGDRVGKAIGCPKPGVTYVKNGDDCYDNNPLARPGQTAFFTNDRGDGSYDYDCNGASERRVTTLQVYCLCSDFGCSINQGWIGAAPDCGETGAWATGPLNGTCAPVRELRGQACR